jgi:RimJ/RimL family protein N-acetyltransferase
MPIAKPPSHFDTARLRARPAAAADATTVFADYACDAAVARYMTWRPHQHVDETIAFLEHCQAGWADGSEYTWTLWTKEDAAFAGVIAARVHGHAVNLGYALVQRFWHHGLMSEAVGAVTAWALGEPSIFRVWATCDVENLASARVLERVGMHREGVLRRWILHPNVSDDPRDCFCYAAVKAPSTSPSR